MAKTGEQEQLFITPPSALVLREVEAGDVVGGAGGLEGEGAARGVEPDLSGQGRAALLAEDEHVVLEARSALNGLGPFLLGDGPGEGAIFGEDERDRDLGVGLRRP